jgi:hypothetical protein
MAEPHPSASFEAQRREQRRAWLRLSPRERLDWLEQAKRFAARSLHAARARAEASRRKRSR